jgi:hypothetical protein
VAQVAEGVESPAARSTATAIFLPHLPTCSTVGSRTRVACARSPHFLQTTHDAGTPEHEYGVEARSCIRDLQFMWGRESGHLLSPKFLQISTSHKPHALPLTAPSSGHRSRLRAPPPTTRSSTPCPALLFVSRVHPLAPSCVLLVLPPSSAPLLPPSRLPAPLRGPFHRPEPHPARQVPFLARSLTARSLLALLLPPKRRGSGRATPQPRSPRGSQALRPAPPSGPQLLPRPDSSTPQRP